MKKIIWYIFVAILVITAVVGDIYMVNSSNRNMEITQTDK